LISLQVVTDFLKPLNHQTSKELLGQSKDHFIADMIHQIARRANLHDNRHEILDKLHVHLFERHLEDLVNKVNEGADEFIGSFLHDRNGLLIEVADNLIDGDKRVHLFGDVSILHQVEMISQVIQQPLLLGIEEAHI
jgi:hypothetical protein